MDCFLVPQWDLRCLYAKAVVPNQHFFEGPTPPLLKLKFPRYRQVLRLSRE